MVEFFLAEYSKEEKAVFRVKGFQGKTFADLENTLLKTGICPKKYSLAGNVKVIICNDTFEIQAQVDASPTGYGSYVIPQDYYVIYDFNKAYVEDHGVPKVDGDDCRDASDLKEYVLDLEDNGSSIAAMFRSFTEKLKNLSFV